MDRLAGVLAAIDAANADDPHTIEIDGQRRPKELAHAEMMSRWVEHLDPACTDEQRIAARAHHIRRWAIPRSSYPAGRAGYLRWRTAQRRAHAADVARLMGEVGYDDAAIERVRQIVSKQGLGHDPAVQVHQDALCLVFLETQLGAVGDQLGEPKTLDVLRKTLRKMSAAGVAAAGELPLSIEAAGLLDRALAAPSD